MEGFFLGLGVPPFLCTLSASVHAGRRCKVALVRVNLSAQNQRQLASPHRRKHNIHDSWKHFQEKWFILEYEMYFYFLKRTLVGW